jgi:hypothetical protein
MHRLLYLAPLIVALVNLCGYAQVGVSSTALLVFVLGALFCSDILVALRRGRTALRLRNIPVAASITLFVITLIRSAGSVEDTADYDGAGAVFGIITPFLMFFPAAWIAMTERVTQKRLVNVLKFFVCYGLALDLSVSALQLAYVLFIDPSGGIFTSNERLNSVVQFENIRIVGLFASGLDHGFYLTISSGLAWVLSGVDQIKLRTLVFLLVANSVIVYFTYTRTAYIAHVFLLVIIALSLARRRFGVVLSILSIAVVLACILSNVELRNVAQTVSDLANSRSLLNLQTMESRYGSWGYYESLVGNRPVILLTGAGILQSAFPFLRMQPPLIDNMYLALVLYGGVLFLAAYLLFVFYYLAFFFKVFLRDKTSVFDARMAVVLCTSIGITLLVGFSATVWDLLSIGLPVSVLWALSWSYFRYLGSKEIRRESLNQEA